MFAFPAKDDIDPEAMERRILKKVEEPVAKGAPLGGLHDAMVGQLLPLGIAASTATFRLWSAWGQATLDYFDRFDVECIAESTKNADADSSLSVGLGTNFVPSRAAE